MQFSRRTVNQCHGDAALPASRYRVVVLQIEGESVLRHIELVAERDVVVVLSAVHANDRPESCITSEGPGSLRGRRTG